MKRVIDVNGSETLRINAAAEIIYVTRDNLAQIEGKSMENILYGRREKRFLIDRYRRIFMDINPVCFLEVVDYLNYCKIVYNDSTLVNPHVGK